MRKLGKIGKNKQLKVSYAMIIVLQILGPIISHPYSQIWGDE